METLGAERNMFFFSKWVFAVSLSVVLLFFGLLGMLLLSQWENYHSFRFVTGSFKYPNMFGNHLYVGSFWLMIIRLQECSRERVSPLLNQADTSSVTDRWTDGWADRRQRSDACVSLLMYGRKDGTGLWQYWNDYKYLLQMGLHKNNVWALQVISVWNKMKWKLVVGFDMP